MQIENLLKNCMTVPLFSGVRGVTRLGSGRDIGEGACGDGGLNLRTGTRRISYYQHSSYHRNKNGDGYEFRYPAATHFTIESLLNEKHNPLTLSVLAPT